MTKDTRFPTLHVVGDSIPSAFYRAMDAVWNNGASVRTEYDRKDASGEYIDPPSRDARVLIEVIDPFKEPRFPIASFSEVGTYIAELMGAKDHMVVPLGELKVAVTGGNLEATEWPYTYHQRLTAHPDMDGSEVNQLELALDRVAETPYTRRAVADTAVPNLDPYLKEDVPCLREIQLRALEDDDGALVLNMNTVWRSRDLYKAWADNVIAVTFLQRELARDLERKTGKPVMVGSYADYSTSLHIYGQDFSHVEGDAERGLRSFLDNFPEEEDFINRSMRSGDASETLVIPQLEGLLTEEGRRQWNFPPESIELIEGMINSLKKGETP